MWGLPAVEGCSWGAGFDVVDSRRGFRVSPKLAVSITPSPSIGVVVADLLARQKRRPAQAWLALRGHAGIRSPGTGTGTRNPTDGGVEQLLGWQLAVLVGGGLVLVP